MRAPALAALQFFAVLVISPATATAAPVAVRSIEVGAAGWVEVELDAEALARLGPAGGVEVLAPSGGAVSARRMLAAETRRCRAVEVGSVERIGDAFALTLHLGAMPGPHAALRFALDEQTLAPGCRLDAEERGAWRELARADLFRLGEASGLAATWFEYPESRAKRLRLLWPVAAGYPAVRAVEACEREPRRHELRRAVDGVARLATGGGGDRFRLPTPAISVPLRALHLVSEGASRPTAYRVWFPQDGRWHEWVAGGWPAGASELRIALGDSAFPGGALRLDLFGPGTDSVVASWELAPQSLRFRAESPGRYRLRLPAGSAAAAAPAGRDQNPLLATLGPVEVEAGVAIAPALGAAPEDRALTATYAVVGERVPVGAPVALALPRETGGQDATRVRLVSEGRQVPARIEIAAEPVRVVAQEARAPATVARGKSRLAVDAALEDLAGTSPRIELLVARSSGPFERRVGLELSSDSPGRPPVRLATAFWKCLPGPAPCALGLDFALAEPRRGDRLALVFDDGDAAPLGPIEIEVGHPVTRAIFQWPRTSVELRLARDTFGAPRFDLSALEGALEISMPVEVRLGARHEVEPGWLEGRRKPLLALAVALAAATLLALVARLVPRRAEASPRPPREDPPGSVPPG